MTRLINAAESWSTVYTSFANINFTAFDYNTVKQSLLDYLQLYFPEDFSDYIESSEFIAILELFAYVCEQLAYRVDQNAQENFLSSAQRKESVLRLAQLISYTPTRNLPARGLVKIQSITTTQTVFDSLGNNLANVKIVWNDPSNVNWNEQFMLVMNLVLQQTFGSVQPSDRVQIGDVLFELYALNNSPLAAAGTGGEVFSYTAIAAGVSQPMEVVPVVLDPTDGPEEKRPENNVSFTLLYANDGLGDGSPTTGFLMMTKQGTLQSVVTTFDGITPNQTYDIGVDNINNTDVWLNNVDPTTLNVLTVNPIPTSVTSQLTGYNTVFGYWYPVDTLNAQNVIFNYTNNNRHQFQEQSNDNDDVTLIFGDGEMVDIPNGTFQIWYRVSANANISISASAVQNQPASFSYVDDTQTTQTFSFTFSLTSSLLNASASETIQHIQDTAPSVYYTQDRMVNGQDYNTFMLQDPSILALVAVNRTFAGDSKYIPWHDPSGSYENVKIFGDDLALYFDAQGPATGKTITVSTPVSSEILLLNYIQPLLSSIDFFTYLAPMYNAIGGDPATLRTSFNSTELTAIQTVLNSSAQTIYFYYQVAPPDNWVTNTTGISPGASYSYMILVTKVYSGSNQVGWIVQYATSQMIAQSEDTDFWNTNNGLETINYDTLNSNQDTILVLSANINAQGGILGENLTYNVMSQVTDPTTGLANVNELSVLPTDTNGDGIPEDMAQVELLNYTVQIPITSLTPVNSGLYTLTLPRTYVIGYSGQDLVVDLNYPTSATTTIEYLITNDNTQPAYFSEVQLPNAVTSNQIQIGGTVETINGPHVIGVGDTIQVTMNDFVYLTRATVSDSYYPVATTDSAKAAWAANASTIPQLQTWVRYSGRYPFNFAWFHQTTLYYLVDPAPSNIIDIYILTVGYYEALTQWLAGQTDVMPTQPTPLDLRTSYDYLLNNAMISDTVVLQSGTFQLLFGSNAIPQLQASFVVVRPSTTVSLTNNQVANTIVSITQDFFDPNEWEFGETFYFTELATLIQTQLAGEIDTIVLVPTFSTNQFGDLYEITPAPNQLFLADISVSNIQFVSTLSPQVLRQAGF